MLPDATAEWPRPDPYDFTATTRFLRTGPGDPTYRREAEGCWRTAHTPDGPATVHICVGDAVRADAWGPGATAVLADVPRWLGLHEPPWMLPSHPVVDRLAQAHAGLRLTDTRDVFEALIVVVLQQLVTWEEATATWRRLCLDLGEPAPGPGGLRLSPTARAVRAVGPQRLQDCGVRRQQAFTLVEVARAARALQRAATLPTADAASLLERVSGIGPWTSAMVLGLRLGRPEPVPLGDLHLPHQVTYALAGEERGSDARMLELLAPFPQQAFRVIQLIYAASIQAPRRAPRMPNPPHRRR